MPENTITITLERYNELLKNEERIATVERMYKANKYFSDDNIKTVLGIEEKGDEDALL